MRDHSLFQVHPQFVHHIVLAQNCDRCQINDKYLFANPDTTADYWDIYVNWQLQQQQNWR